MRWEEQAADNFKWVFYSELEFQTTEQIARRLSRTFENAKDYNEAVRTSAHIEPILKLWLVVPSYQSTITGDAFRITP